MKTSSLLFILASVVFFQCQSKKETVPATTAENQIIQENKNEGTTSWLINVPEKHCEYPDHQYCRRPQIEAFCSKASYLAGDTLSIFVSTDPASSYSLDIYRMGY